MVRPDERHTTDINDEIQSLRNDVNNLNKKQDISNIVQIQSWCLALGITVLGIALALALYLRGGFDIFVTLSALGLLILALILIMYSRQLASIIWNRELRQASCNMNQTQRRPNVPPILRKLAKGVAFVLCALGCLYLVAAFSYVVLSSFGFLKLTFSIQVISMLFILGIGHLILFYITVLISRTIE